MRKRSVPRNSETRAEYDFSKLGPGARGKYFELYRAGMLIIENGMEPPRKRRVRKRRDESEGAVAMTPVLATSCADCTTAMSRRHDHDIEIDPCAD